MVENFVSPIKNDITPGSALMRSRLEILTKEERKQIYASALQVLSETGVLIKNKNAKEILQINGVEFKPNSDIAIFSEGLIKECLQKAPKSVMLYDRQGTLAMTLEGNKPHYNDPRTSTAEHSPHDSTGNHCRHCHPTINRTHP